MNEIQKHWDKQARWLTQALIISGALNVGLILTFFYLFVKDRYLAPVIEHKPASAEEKIEPLADHRSSIELIKSFKTLSFDQLVLKLTDKQLVEDGFSHRDLALATLVSFYHFNIQKALSGNPTQQRQLVLEKRGDSTVSEVILFPGLSDTHFDSIIYYAKTERWPLTSKGLYLQMKHSKEKSDPSLMEAFYHTAEYLEVEALFNHLNAKADKPIVLKMMIEGDWNSLTEFVQAQLMAQELSEARLQRLLLDYVDRRSQTAARFMLALYGDFAVKKLDDEHVIKILLLFPEKTPEAEKFAQVLLVSPRSEMVWKLAAARLYQYAKEPLPDTYDHIAALTKFIPEKILKEKIKIGKNLPAPTKVAADPKPVEIKPSAAKQTAEEKKAATTKPSEAKPSKASSTKPPSSKIKERVHVIQEGETLWLISKKYKVTVEKIKSANNLKNDNIRVGKTLKIPESPSN